MAMAMVVGLVAVPSHAAGDAMPTYIELEDAHHAHVAGQREAARRVAGGAHRLAVGGERQHVRRPASNVRGSAPSSLDFCYPGRSDNHQSDNEASRGACKPSIAGGRKHSYTCRAAACTGRCTQTAGGSGRRATPPPAPSDGPSPPAPVKAMASGHPQPMHDVLGRMCHGALWQHCTHGSSAAPGAVLLMGCCMP